MNAMKKTNAKKKLIPAAAMLAISAAMLSTATYAWFTMSKTVEVSGLQVNATADKGLVISGDAKNTWLNTWPVGMSTSVGLLPTNTNGSADITQLKWVSATSNNYDDEDSDQNEDGAYTSLDIEYSTTALASNGNKFSEDDEGLGVADNKNYVLVKNFYVKSTGVEALNETFVVDKVEATISDNTTPKLYQSLRVLVVVTSGDNKYSAIYAPVSEYDNTINFKGEGGGALTLKPSTEDLECTNITTIPNTDNGAIKVQLYLYFEGEDDNCKSSNLTASLNPISVSASFTTKAVQDSGD